MQRATLIILGGLALGTAAYILGATQYWYDNVPGVVLTGPLNFHFAKDVGFAYLASGAALIWAGVKLDKSAGVFGAIWPVLHAFFHIWIWIDRGVPLDFVALVNLTGIQIPAFLALFVTVNLKTKGTKT